MLGSKYTTLLEKNKTDPKKCEDYVAKIQASSDFLLSLINNVLEMARIESGKRFWISCLWRVEK